MPARLGLDLRTATLDDAAIVADLEGTRDPADPRDPEMLRFWWTMGSLDEETIRLVAVRGGSAVAFVAAGHRRSETTEPRFGSLRPILHADGWTEAGYSHLVSTAEAWLRSEHATTAVARVGADFEREVAVLSRLGYREMRRHRLSELDLGAGREILLADAVRHRRHVTGQGVQLMTLDGDSDPDRMTKLYELMTEADEDIPTTVPWRTIPFDLWKSINFDNPGIRQDRFWIAREGDAIVGVSMLQFPPVRGVPWTALTGTSRAVRGRGIARALKYATVAQAINLGCKVVRTGNDGANAPILHLNEAMGYRLFREVIELHRELKP
jgi:RimJ/RimL family protein N-acetyltransferase